VELFHHGFKVNQGVNPQIQSDGVRFPAHNGLKSDIAPCPKSAKNSHALALKLAVMLPPCAASAASQ
jgi:hypothetical protein